MKQVEVQIMGQSYLLGCPEGGEKRLLEAASRVDVAMTRIRDAGKTKARDRIAVLAALNLAFEIPERSAEAPAAPVTPPAPQAEHAADGTTDQARLTQLLQRLDNTLAHDGHLL